MGLTFTKTDTYEEGIDETIARSSYVTIVQISYVGKLSAIYKRLLRIHRKHVVRFEARVMMKEF